MCMAPEFLNNKCNHIGFMKLVLMNVYPLPHGAGFLFFYLRSVNPLMYKYKLLLTLVSFYDSLAFPYH